VTIIQRFGGGLNLNVHFHTLVLDGVFTEREGDTLHFQERAFYVGFYASWRLR